MKKTGAALAAILFLAACQPADNPNELASGSLTVNGTILGLENGYLEMMMPSKESEKVDSVKIEKGKFTLKTDLKEPELIVMRIAGAPQGQGGELVFFADPGTISIKGKVDSLWKSTIEGGKSQKLFKEINDKTQDMMKKGQDLYPAYMQAQQTQNQAEMMRIEQEFIKMQSAAKDYAVAEAKKNVNNVASALIALQYLGQAEGENDGTALKSLYDTLSPAVKKSYFGKKVADIVKSVAATAVGAMAPDFTQATPDGKTLSLSSLRGKYVLVDFWASWCGPCRQENPNVVKAYNSFKDKGFTILGVSLDEDKDKWLEAIATDQLAWNQVSDLKYWKNDAAVLYGVKSIPANFLLDKEGKIIGRNLRGADLEKKLGEVLN